MGVFDGLYRFIVIGFSEPSPLDIATNAERFGKVTLHNDGMEGFMELFQLNNLFFYLKKMGLIISAISIIMILISMYFISRSDRLAEKKADIMHKLVIVFLICSCLFILSAVVAVLDIIF